MQTIEQLISGELIGVKKVKISSGLNEFPKELFELKETLEFLDLSGNNISELPDNFQEFKKLKIVFISNNKFTIFPKVLADCPNLTMIGFRSNQIVEIPENSFPLNLQWLILTENKIEVLPNSIGDCKYLQKFAISGNRLKTLPNEMKNCRRLELLRISANLIDSIPSWLLLLPRLSWLAYSGNPCSIIDVNLIKIDTISWDDLEVKQQLGEGASGIISKAIWKSKDSKEVAVKVFKGEVTSDGLPEDELATCIAAGDHPNLVPLIAEIINHSEFKKGIVMGLIPSDYSNLGNPPSFETCTRDVFSSTQTMFIEKVVNILSNVASVSFHLHERGILHGDLYAHNTMINENGDALLGDFGAATFYNQSDETSLLIERLDVRAFGCLIEDLLNQVSNKESTTYDSLFELKNKCMNEIVYKRVDFKEILNTLKIQKTIN